MEISVTMQMRKKTWWWLYLGPEINKLNHVRVQQNIDAVLAVSEGILSAHNFNFISKRNDYATVFWCEKCGKFCAMKIDTA